MTETPPRSLSMSQFIMCLIGVVGLTAAANFTLLEVHARVPHQDAVNQREFTRALYLLDSMEKRMQDAEIQIAKNQVKTYCE